MTIAHHWFPVLAPHHSTAVLTLSLNVSNTGTSATANSSAFTHPAVGDLIVVAPLGSAGTTFSTPTDNSAGGGAWTALGSTLSVTGHNAVQLFYKVANANDHANLTLIQCVLSASQPWGFGTWSWTGWLGTATLDLSGSYTSGGGTTNNATVTFGSGPISTPEVAIFVMLTSGLTGAETRYYSPDGGTTHYFSGSLADAGSVNIYYYGLPTTGGSSAEWVESWTGSALTARAESFTFYDH